MQGGQGAGVEELVGQGDRRRSGVPSPAATAAAATVSNSPPTTVWFSRVTASRSVSISAQHGLGVERLDRRGVHDGDVDVVRGELLGGLQRPHGHQPAGDEHDVAPGRSTLALPSSKV